MLPGSSCGSSFLSNLVYSTDFCFPSSCQLDSSLNSQETRYEPIWCQMPFYHPRTSTLCSPCQSIHTGSLSHGFSRGYCLGYGSRTCYSLGFGSCGFRPLLYGVCGFPSLSHRSQFYNPMYVASGSCQTSCDQSTFYIWLLLLFSFLRVLDCDFTVISFKVNLGCY